MGRTRGLLLSYLGLKARHKLLVIVNCSHYNQEQIVIVLLINLVYIGSNSSNKKNKT